MEEHDLVPKDEHAENAAVAEPKETQESTALPLPERSLPENSSKATSDAVAEQLAGSQDSVLNVCTNGIQAFGTVILACPRTQQSAMLR